MEMVDTASLGVDECFVILKRDSIALVTINPPAILKFEANELRLLAADAGLDPEAFQTADVALALVGQSDPSQIAAIKDWIQQSLSSREVGTLEGVVPCLSYFGPQLLISYRGKRGLMPFG
jgi:hypothetical protein